MKLATLIPWLLLAWPLLVLSAPQYRQAERQRQGRVRGRGRGGGARAQVRQSQIGRRVPAIPEVEEYGDDGYGEEYEDEGDYAAPGQYNEEQQSGYGYTRDSNEYVRSSGSSGSRNTQARGDRQGNREYGGGSRESEEIIVSAEYGEERRESEEMGGMVEGSGDQGREEETKVVDKGGEEIDQTPEEEGAEGDCGSDCRNLMHESEHPKEDARCPYEGMVIDVWGYCRYQFEMERRDWSWWETVRQQMYHQG